MLSAGQEEGVNEKKLWKGRFNFKYSMYGARQAGHFIIKIFFKHMAAQELLVSEMFF